ncbi:TetR/AcrR family transcriptional regulator [Photobacterium lucens]|uniref:TetR/AcrR family transcriptional regulator n=1 Tax=Photobacterium lucens TaxID=2562949 RepID=UPI0013699F90|nr:TetR/AcrR family transcriptional regulator [Photobacterium lucens]MBP2699996.1 TetR/AcrR family transcriptional regulator [Vibrio parahaemolyticus]MZG55314.1 TetR/AcrR family transcriptional regulator [Photobacterium lucens]MZG82897.1 TetR/AcrR family transcriptional regulator [Photobacterium lucens]
MANTPKFDRQQVIDKATNLYWAKGFHATSMRDLQNAIDMRSGSIYAAFGSKEELFKLVLQNYLQQGIVELNEYQQTLPSPLAALKRFIEQLVIETPKTAPNGLCFLAKTIAELTSDQQELLDEACQLLDQMEAEFEKVIIDAQECGEIDKEKDPAKLARYIQVQIAGLRTYAKAHPNHAPLQEMIDDIFTNQPFV